MLESLDVVGQDGDLLAEIASLDGVVSDELLLLQGQVLNVGHQVLSLAPLLLQLQVKLVHLFLHRTYDGREVLLLVL